VSALEQLRCILGSDRATLDHPALVVGSLGSVIRLLSIGIAVGDREFHFFSGGPTMAKKKAAKKKAVAKKPATKKKATKKVAKTAKKALVGKGPRKGIVPGIIRTGR